MFLLLLFYFSTSKGKENGAGEIEHNETMPVWPSLLLPTVKNSVVIDGEKKNENHVYNRIKKRRKKIVWLVVELCVYVCVVYIHQQVIQPVSTVMIFCVRRSNDEDAERGPALIVWFPCCPRVVFYVCVCVSLSMSFKSTRPYFSVGRPSLTTLNSFQKCMARTRCRHKGPTVFAFLHPWSRFRVSFFILLSLLLFSSSSSSANSQPFSRRSYF